MKLEKTQSDALLGLAAKLAAASVLAGPNGDVPDDALALMGLGVPTLEGALVLAAPMAPTAQPTDGQDQAHEDGSDRGLMDGREPWLYDAYGMAVGTNPRYPSQLDRFEASLYAIPDWMDYAALVHEFSGKWPDCPRPGRPDDRPAVVPPAVDDALESAYAFFEDDLRRHYVKHGGTDLGMHFNRNESGWLGDNARVYLLKDLDRFSAAGILCLSSRLGLMAENPDLSHKLWAYKARQAEQANNGGTGNGPGHGAVLDHDRWVSEAYLAAMGTEPRFGSQLDRFLDVIGSIPDWADYAAFEYAFSGKCPNYPRDNRPEDRPFGIPDDLDRHLESAYAFLRADSRRRYVQEGLTDLLDWFESADIDWLRDKLRVYVLADLDRFDASDILDVSADFGLMSKNPDLSYKLWSWKARQAEIAMGVEKAGDE